MQVSRIKNGQTNFSLAWESLGILEMAQFLNLWIVFTVIGNFFQLFGGILSFYQEDVLMSTNEALIGLGCFCAWIGTVKFFDNTGHSYTIINTLTRSFMIIGPYMVGVLPIFMAYVFFAICSFWETGIYPNTHMAMIASFAMVNGDSVYAFGTADFTQNAFFGQLFYYTFVVFFILYLLYSFVQNLFIAIIQSGYKSIKTDPPIKWDEFPEEEERKKQESEYEPEEKIQTDSNKQIEKSQRHFIRK